MILRIHEAFCLSQISKVIKILVKLFCIKNIPEKNIFSLKNMYYFYFQLSPRGQNVVSVTTNGATSMIGKEVGFVNLCWASTVVLLLYYSPGSFVCKK